MSVTSPLLLPIPESPPLDGKDDSSKSSDDLDVYSTSSSSMKTSPMSLKASAFSIDSLISRKRSGSALVKSNDVNTSPIVSILNSNDNEDDTGSIKAGKRCRVSPSTVPALSHNPMDRIECRLEGQELWNKFNELGTEMIITKSGRRMFPVVRVSFSGLDPTAQYLLALDIVPVDQRRYRYAYHRSSWLVAGKAERTPHTRVLLHPDSCWTGEQLMRQTVPFDRVKLTNNPVDKHGYIILNSMHKYQPRVHLIQSSNTAAFNNCSEDPLKAFKPDQIKTFVLSETSFIAVTAYQNQLITKLKIDCNPFAKGFRDSSRLSDFERDSVEALLSCQSGKKNYLGESYSQMKPSANDPVNDRAGKLAMTTPLSCPADVIQPFQPTNAEQYLLFNQLAALSGGRLNFPPTLSPLSLLPYSGLESASSSWAQYMATMASMLTSPQYTLTSAQDYHNNNSNDKMN